MSKHSLLFTMLTVMALCVTGFISLQNLVAQIYNILGGGHQPFWDAVWVEPGIHLSFGFAMVFGAAFYGMSRLAMRYRLLTRNHILIILVGIIMFIVFSDYVETTDTGWS